MSKIKPLLALLVVLFGPVRTGFAERAQPVFLHWAEPLGICDDKVIFYGENKPGVYNGLYWTDGKVVRLIRDFFDSGSIVDNVWQRFPQRPPLIGPVPLRLYKNRSHAFLTACATPGSIKVVQQNFYPGFGENYVIQDNRLVFGRVNRSSTEIVRLTKNGLTVLGRAPSKQARSDRGGLTRLYSAQRGLLFEVADSKTTRRTLWTINNGSGAKLVSDFAELIAEGFTQLEVREPIETGEGNVYFRVDGKTQSGAEQAIHYVTDGETTRRITAFPSLTQVFDTLPLRSINGALVVYTDYSGPTATCKLGLVSFANLSFQDITAALGNVNNLGMWCYRMASKTSKASLFFAHETSPNRLMRLNLNTLQVSEVFTADARIEGMWFFRDMMYFRVDTPSGASKLYVTDGTPAGTEPITVGNRPLLGTDMSSALFYKGNVFLAGYTRANGDSLLDYGLYRFLMNRVIGE